MITALKNLPLETRNIAYVGKPRRKVAARKESLAGFEGCQATVLRRTKRPCLFGYEEHVFVGESVTE